MKKEGKAPSKGTITFFLLIFVVKILFGVLELVPKVAVGGQLLARRKCWPQTL